MSRSVSLFSGYDQRENRTTNYCLLVLKLLYEENPKFLSEFLGAIVTETLGNEVGIKFLQQEKSKTGIPDAVIRQPAFTLFIETKNYDWFYDDQLERHLAALEGETSGWKVLIALGNFEAREKHRFERIRELCRSRYRSSLVFVDVAFEEFAAALPSSGVSKNLADVISDFRAYLDEEGLLPAWPRLLDVVNCAGLPEEVIEGNVYMCPATGGAYNHGRCKFFGMYRNKCVEQVAIIEAVIDLESETSETIRWKNVEHADADLIAIARQKHEKFRLGDYPTRIFVLGPLMETRFLKDTPGGMMGSKLYFDMGPKIKTAEELAAALRGRTWTDVRTSV